MSFYGLPPDEMAEAMRHINAAIEIYVRNDQSVLAVDNMLVARRTLSFMRDKKFAKIIEKYCYDENGAEVPTDLVKVWRLHVYAWCAQNALKIDGDLVECGVHMGLYSLVMLEYLSPLPEEKSLYLYDTFEGLDDELSTEQERDQVEGVYDIEDWFEAVSNSFADYSCAKLIKGRVPDILHESAPEKVAFLHLDMNSASAEVGAIDFFQDRLAPGAIILMDDYGRTDHVELHIALRDWFEFAKRPIVELPTGQGLALWL